MYCGSCLFAIVIILIGPCLFGGNCTNTDGFFACSCPPNRRGHRCQYEILCDNDTLCGDGETCVETLASSNGYVCVSSTQANNTLTIMLREGISPDALNEEVYNLVSKLKFLEFYCIYLATDRSLTTNGFQWTQETPNFK